MDRKTNKKTREKKDQREKIITMICHKSKKKKIINNHNKIDQLHCMQKREHV